MDCVTTPEYEKSLTDFGIVKEDSIFSAFLSIGITSYNMAKGDDDNITLTPPKSRKSKIESVHDRDAKYAKKTIKIDYFRYKTRMAMSAEIRFITHTETTPMDAGDPTMAPALVDGAL